MYETYHFVGLVIAFLLFAIGVIIITLELAPISSLREDANDDT